MGFRSLRLLLVLDALGFLDELARPDLVNQMRNAAGDAEDHEWGDRRNDSHSNSDLQRIADGHVGLLLVPDALLSVGFHNNTFQVVVSL